jgi:hypothetical protein
MLDFCAEHGITADIELIPIQQINEAYKRLLKSDVKYRFVSSIWHRFDNSGRSREKQCKSANSEKVSLSLSLSSFR